MIRTLVVILVFWCCLTRQQLLRAPPGWYVNGAHPDGSYELRAVLGHAQEDLLDAWLKRELAGPPPVQGRLICTGGARIHQDGLKVWCQR